jgi:nucleotide-binding universal stress UspA family protein
MFENIVLAVDGSEHAERAVPVAGEIARRFGGEVVVVHVREHQVTWGEDIDAETEREAMELVDGVVRELKDSGANARTEVVRVPVGHVGHEIVRVAEHEGAHLIVMGTRGLSGWERLLIGSVADRVVHLATCPVLVVR